MSVTQEIKDRLDIVDVISSYVSLRKSGNSYTGFCPFHQNTRTPAFVVFPNSQTWRCFGACADGGDVYSFLMKKEGWDFKEALTQLADRTGVELQQHSPAEQAQQAEEDRLASLLAAATDYFHQLLLHAPQAEYARRYVTGRGLEEKTVATFRLGYALNSWDACRTHFTAQGYSAEDLLDAGLLSQNEERGTTYDRFRNRFMIPIRDVNGRVVGFGARALHADDIPKYLNSPQSTLFDKSQILYGLDGARRHIREARQAVIVEGYLDVMQAWQYGFRNVVAQMGTALTDRQLGLLKRYTKRFVIALDSDAAGVKATLRSLEVARGALDREADVRFDARGLVHHEGRLEADIRVVTLPEGEDPDSLIRRDPTEWPQLLEGARPVVQYVIDLVTADLDHNDAKAKTAVAQQVLPLIGDIANPIEREHYRGKLARALRIDERALRQLVVTSRPPGQRAVVDRQKAGLKQPKAGSRLVAPGDLLSRSTTMRESNYLRQCLRYPALMTLIDHKLRAYEQAPVTEADFTQVEDRALLVEMRAHMATINGNVVSLEELCDSLEKPLRERVQFLLTLPVTPDTQLDRLPDNLVLSILDWRLDKIKQRLGEVKQLFQEAKSQGDADALDLYNRQILDLTMVSGKINKAKGSMSALSRRRAEEANSR